MAWSDSTTTGRSPSVLEGVVLQQQRPVLYYPTHLRRYRVALGDGLYNRVPVVVVGDSIVAGQGANNVNAIDDANQWDKCWVAQLRTFLAQAYGDAGEGFVFAGTRSFRITIGSGSNFQQYGPLRMSTRLLSGSGNNITLAVPTGPTTVGVIQANNSGDVSALFAWDGGGAANVTTLSGSGSYVETELTNPNPAATHSLVLTAPASAQTYISGFTLRKLTTGVTVHRVGSAGYVVGDMLGGQTAGVLTQTGPNQIKAQRACYQEFGSTGLLVVSFGINDQQNQAGGGAQGGITAPLFRTWAQQICDQAVADGWCVLLVGEPRSPSALSTGYPESAYYTDSAKDIARTTDHVAYMDFGEAWGPAVDSQAAGLQFAASVHPVRLGHGDLARQALRNIAGGGLTNPTLAP